MDPGIHFDDDDDDDDEDEDFVDGTVSYTFVCIDVKKRSS